MKKRLKKLSTKYRAQILQNIFLLSQNDIDDIMTNIPPLQKGDKLFVNSINPSNPKIVQSFANDIYFEQGYASAAIFLLGVVEYGKNYLRKDSYIYPALFCLRMYLEIIMKLILTINAKDIKGGHNLMIHWKKLKEIFNEESNDEDFERVENLISELNSYDPMATTFRYPRRLNNLYAKCEPQIESKFIDMYLQPIITQYFIDNKSEIWLLFLIAHSKR